MKRHHDDAENMCQLPSQASSIEQLTQESSESTNHQEGMKRPKLAFQEQDRGDQSHGENEHNASCESTSLKRGAEDVGGVPPAPTRRCRRKTSQKQLQQENNIRVAYNYVESNSSTQQVACHQAKAIVTRGDLLATSTYFKYHSDMGHVPDVVVTTTSHRRKRLLAQSNLAEQIQTTTQVYIMKDLSKRRKTQLLSQ